MARSASMPSRPARQAATRSSPDLSGPAEEQRSPDRWGRQPLRRESLGLRRLHPAPVLDGCRSPFKEPFRLPPLSMTRSMTDSAEKRSLAVSARGGSPSWRRPVASEPLAGPVDEEPRPAVHVRRGASLRTAWGPQSAAPASPGGSSASPKPRRRPPDVLVHGRKLRTRAASPPLTCSTATPSTPAASTPSGTPPASLFAASGRTLRRAPTPRVLESSCDAEAGDGAQASEGAQAGELAQAGEGAEGSDWRCGRKIGLGSYGCVFRALNTRTGCIAAVKRARFDESSPDDRRHRQKLEEELQICKSLRHMHIVSYLGYEYVDSHLCIYLEYVPGGSLAAVLSEFGPLDLPLFRKAAVGLLEGLDYLHTRSPPVVHRDVKAANVLVDLGFCVKLADFGCSRRDSVTKSFTTVGSVPWMAPEVIHLLEGHGRKADIWSLGCTLIEMATAEKPWGEGRFDNIIFAMQHIGMSGETPPIPEALPADARDMVGRCLQRNPDARPWARELRRHPFLGAAAAGDDAAGQVAAGQVAAGCTGIHAGPAAPSPGRDV